LKTVYINKIEQLEVARNLLKEVLILMREELKTVQFFFHPRYSSLPGPLSLSLQIIKEIIRQGCLEQEGLSFKEINCFFPPSEGVAVERNKDNEIVEKRKVFESPGIVEEILEESREQHWKTEGRIVYWNLGNIKFLTLFSDPQHGLLLTENGTVLFSKEIEKIKEGQILPTQDEKNEFKGYATTRGELFQVWAKK